MDRNMIIRDVADRLTSSAEEMRYLAVRDLTGVGSVEAVPFLLGAVGDSSYRVREEAFQGICRLPSDQVFPRLESCVRDHDDAGLRNAAIEAFPRYGEAATDYLLEMLKDDDEEVRLFTAQMLGEVKDVRSVEALIASLGDGDENVRHAVAESLGKIGDPRAVEPLLGALEDGFWTQYPAVIALGEIGDPSATGPLLKLLPEEMLRQAVVEALGKIGDVEAIPVLAEILSQDDPFIRNVTIAALVNIQSRFESQSVPGTVCLPSIKRTLENGDLIGHLMSSLKGTDTAVKKNAVIALGWLKEKRAVKDLVELLGDYDLEEYAIGSLTSIGDETIPELLRGMKNPDPRIRVSIIRCLGWLGNTEGVRACIPLLDDECTEVRYQTVLAMEGDLGSDEVEDALLGLVGGPDPELGELLVEVLGKSPSAGLVGKLLPLLDNGDEKTRLTAIRLLGRLRAGESFEALKPLLSDGSDLVRAAVFNALNHIHTGCLPREILVPGLSDSSPTVRKEAAGCLSSGNGEAPEETILPLLEDEDVEVRLAAVEAIGKIGGPAGFDRLREVYPAGNKQLKLAVIRVLGRVSDKGSTPFLMDLLKGSDAEIKRAVLDSLGEIADRRTIPDLIITLDDPDWTVRSAAVRSLGRIGDKRSVDHLLKMLEDAEDAVKKEAITALGRLRVQRAVGSILPLVHNENLQLDVLVALEDLGLPDLEHFFGFLERSNTRLKCSLVDLLGRVGSPGTLDVLVRILENEFFTVRCRAAKAMGELGDRRAIPHLIRAQKEDPSEEVQRGAALALKRLDDR